MSGQMKTQYPGITEYEAEYGLKVNQMLNSRPDWFTRIGTILVIAFTAMLVLFMNFLKYPEVVKISGKVTCLKKVSAASDKETFYSITVATEPILKNMPDSNKIINLEYRDVSGNKTKQIKGTVLAISNRTGLLAGGFMLKIITSGTTHDVLIKDMQVNVLNTIYRQTVFNALVTFIKKSN